MRSAAMADDSAAVPASDEEQHAVRSVELNKKDRLSNLVS